MAGLSLCYSIIALMLTYLHHLKHCSTRCLTPRTAHCSVRFVGLIKAQRNFLPPVFLGVCSDLMVLTLDIGLLKTIFSTTRLFISLFTFQVKSHDLSHAINFSFQAKELRIPTYFVRPASIRIYNDSQIRYATRYSIY